MRPQLTRSGWGYQHPWQHTPERPISRISTHFRPRLPRTFSSTTSLRTIGAWSAPGLGHPRRHLRSTAAQGGLACSALRALNRNRPRGRISRRAQTTRLSGPRVAFLLLRRQDPPARHFTGSLRDREEDLWPSGIYLWLPFANTDGEFRAQRGYKRQPRATCRAGPTVWTLTPHATAVTCPTKLYTA